MCWPVGQTEIIRGTPVSITSKDLTVSHSTFLTSGEVEIVEMISVSFQILKSLQL